MKKLARIVQILQVQLLIIVMTGSYILAAGTPPQAKTSEVVSALADPTWFEMRHSKSYTSALIDFQSCMNELCQDL